MAPMVEQKPWTAAELGRLPKGWRYEIDEGKLVIMAPAGFRHGNNTNWVAYVLTGFVHSHGLGQVVSGEVGVCLQRDPQVLRGVDVAFYSNERLARITDKNGFPEVPPDLAVEVHLPSEPDMERKVRQYLEAGVRSVWVIDPRTRILTMHRPGQEPVTLSDPAATVLEPVLPGFSCHLAEICGEA